MLHNAAGVQSPNLTWLVTNCGHLKLGGSQTWQGLCQNWEALRKHLQPSQPANIEEWRSTPPWRPHMNQQHQPNPDKLSKDQRLLREAGFHTMGDIMDLGDTFIEWDEAALRGTPQLSMSSGLPGSEGKFGGHLAHLTIHAPPCQPHLSMDSLYGSLLPSQDIQMLRYKTGPYSIISTTGLYNSATYCGACARRS